jgi:23S rRNA pseudouridine2605 synthase
MDEKSELDEDGERVAKVIARAGLASRRQAEAWISDGRVAVNGRTIRSPALNVGARDLISVDGEPLPSRERTRLFLYHKPRGLLTAYTDPQGRPTIFQHLPKNLPRLISVGRLDFNTEGLLLLTNDGALARILELPSTGWLRRYRVRAHGSVAQEKLHELRAGVTIDGMRYGAIDATLDRVQGSNLWLTFAIREGKNREVRNVLGHLGLAVARLIRVSFGPFQLGDLAEDAVEEVRTRVLREQLGERLVELSGADFSAPIAPRPDPAEIDRHRATKAAERPSASHRSTRHGARPSKPASFVPRGADAKFKSRFRPASSSHSWRARDEERPAKALRRKYHGSRREDAAPRERSTGKARTDLVVDRKGRHVLIERHGEARKPEPVGKPRRDRPRHRPFGGQSGRRPKS